MRRRRALAGLTSMALLVSAGASANLARHATPAAPPSPWGAPVTATTPTTDTDPASSEITPTGSDSAAAEPAAGRPFAVMSDELVLVDDSRAAPDRGSGPTGKSRRLRTIIRWPADVRGRVPLIVFAHGWNTEPATYEPLLDAWASAGYVVAAPELPGSARDLGGTPQRDIADQAHDLSFVANAVIGRYPSLIDPTRIVAAGHSDGGSAVATVALNASYSDHTFTAYVVMSGAIPDQVTDGTWGSGPPDATMLITVGDHDEYDNLSAAQTIYDSTTLPAALVVVPGGDHQNMYLDNSPTSASVRATTIQYLDTVLSSSEPPSSLRSVASDDNFHVQLRASHRRGPS